MADILLVEVSIDCQILVKETLSKVAHVRIATSLQEARIALSNQRFDLILMDLSLPDGDGMEFFSQIQSRADDLGEIPVVFLTGRAETAMQVTAFSMGADDYIVKPLRPIEFRARVEAKLKKIASLKKSETLLVRGDLKIELGTQRASIVMVSSNGAKTDPRELELTGREFKLLYHLARHEGTVFSREQLIAAVWGNSVHVLDRTVDTHIYTLRKKLGTYSSYIESEVGLGYRLNSSRAAKQRKLAA
jgi:DNA-binding response OmpR family regulator